MLRNIYKYILMRSESTNSIITSFLLWDRCLAFPQMASSLFLVNGKLSQWSEWTRCDKLCGHGKEKRYKTCSNPKPRCGGKNCDLSISVEEERPCVYCPGNVLKGFLDLEQCPTFEFFFPVCHKFDHYSWLDQFFIPRRSARSFSVASRTRKIVICTALPIAVIRNLVSRSLLWPRTLLHQPVLALEFAIILTRKFALNSLFEKEVVFFNI